MTHLDDDIRVDEPDQQVFAAVIASSPNDLSERVSVVIPGLDQTLRWEDCIWQARDATSLPARGDRCIVLMDDQKNVSVAIWWPFVS